MNPLRALSGSIYKATELTDDWIGLPRKMSESLHFRQNWRAFLRQPISEPTLWIHGASVGELEDLAAFFMAPGLLEQAGYSRQRLVLTASSISARPRLDSWQQQGFAYAGPLPPESSRETQAFLHLLKPEMLVLSHSDIWPMLFDEAAHRLPRGCVWLPSRRPRQRLLVDRCLRGFVKKIGVRSQDDVGLFSEIAPAHWVGNPRVDRIRERIENARRQQEHVLERHACAPQLDRPSILLGSSWIEDARWLAAGLAALPLEQSHRFQVVVIPHETHDPHLLAAIKGHLPNARVLAVEGVLAEAYRSFSLAFVGGGYRTGLHNILEPALWEVPTLAGPQTDKQPEAPWLQSLGQLRLAPTANDIAAMLSAMLDPTQTAQLRSSAQQAAQQLRLHEGATHRLVSLLLPSPG